MSVTASIHNVPADGIKFDRATNRDGSPTSTRWIALGGEATLFIDTDHTKYGNPSTGPDQLAALIRAAAEGLRSFGLTRGQVAELLDGSGLTVAPAAPSTIPVAA